MLGEYLYKLILGLMQLKLQPIIYILFCWTGIPAILWFFECIGYLIMSVDKFNAKYNYIYPQSSSDAKVDKFDKFTKFEGMDRLHGLLSKWVITQEEYDEGMDDLRTPNNTENIEIWYKYILENLIWNDKVVMYIKYGVLGSIWLFVIYFMWIIFYPFI